MPTVTTSKAIAEKVFQDVLKYWDVKEDKVNGPYLKEGLETDWNTVPFAIVWEGAPYDWGLIMSFGSYDSERVPGKRPLEMPAGFYLENIYSWAVGIYPV
jgi:hypothetical protein